MSKPNLLQKLAITGVAGTIGAISFQGSVEASMLTVRFKATINAAQATAINGAGGLTDVDVRVPNRAKKSNTIGIPNVRYTPIVGPPIVAPIVPVVTNPDPRPIQGNMNFSFPLPAAIGGPVVAGEMYEVAIGPLRTNFGGSEFCFTTPGAGGNPTRICVPVQHFDAQNHKPVVPAPFSFLFPLNLNNSGDVPLVISNFRIFTNVDFGQTTLEEATNEIANFLNPNNELFDSDGMLLIEPPGTEIDVNTLLAEVPEYDSGTETLTIDSLTSLELPPFLLEDDADTGVVMTFARVISEDPEFGTVVSDIALGHQVSQIQIVPESSSTFSILAIGIGGLGLSLTRKLKPSQSTEKETTKVG